MLTRLIFTLFFVAGVVVAVHAADPPALKEKTLAKLLVSRGFTSRLNQVDTVTYQKVNYYCVATGDDNLFEDPDPQVLQRLTLKGKQILLRHLKSADPNLKEISLSRWTNSPPKNFDQQLVSLGCVPVQLVKKDHAREASGEGGRLPHQRP